MLKTIKLESRKKWSCWLKDQISGVWRRQTNKYGKFLCKNFKNNSCGRVVVAVVIVVVVVVVS